MITNILATCEKQTTETIEKIEQNNENHIKADMGDIRS